MNARAEISVYFGRLSCRSETGRAEGQHHGSGGATVNREMYVANDNLSNGRWVKRSMRTWLRAPEVLQKKGTGKGGIN